MRTPRALLLLSLVACEDELVDTGAPLPPEDTSAVTDHDGDGFSESAGDCDDSDAAINPAADEVCDGVDNDCDGTIDNDDALDTSTWYADDDGDGYGDPDDHTTACEQPSAHAANGEDCDDSDAAVNPDGTEIAFDGVDNDCDGVEETTFDLGDAHAKLIGEDDSDYAGWPASGAGDVDGDGLDDLLIGARGEGTGGVVAGAAYLVLGGVSGDLDLADAHAQLVGEARSDYAGRSVSGAGDVDGDGHDDLLIGAMYNDNANGINAGTAYLVLGPVTGGLDLKDADARLIGEGAQNQSGWSVSGAGDADGDGLDDLLVGAAKEDAGGPDAGVAYLVLGPVSGEFDLADAHARLVGEKTDDYAGAAVSGAGDVDGDGHDDLLVGAHGADMGGTDAGAAYLVLGGVSGDLDLADAHAKLIGEGAEDCAGCSVSGAGDVDGDGLDDLLIGAKEQDAGGPDAGAAYLVLGGVAGVLVLGDARAKLIGTTSGGRAGGAVSGAGDVDGDGLDDLLVGAEEEDAVGDNSGAAYLALGPVSGEIALSGTDVLLIGEREHDRAGCSVSGAGDVDGDGLDDLLVGACGETTGGSNAGATYLVLSPY